MFVLFSTAFHIHLHKVETLCTKQTHGAHCYRWKSTRTCASCTRRSLTTGWRLNLSLWQVQGKNSMRDDGCNGPSGCKVVKTPRARFPAGSRSGFGPVGEGWTTKGRGRITRSWQHGSVAARQRDPGGEQRQEGIGPRPSGRRQRTHAGNKPLEARRTTATWASERQEGRKPATVDDSCEGKPLKAPANPMGVTGAIRRVW